MSIRQVHFLRRSLVLGALLMLVGTLMYAASPGWWSATATKIVDESVEDGDNYAPANLGQLKHVASKAKSHLDANLVGGSGTTISTLIATFVTATTPEEVAANYAPLNLGQLKAVAKPFYDRLLDARYGTKENLIARGYSGTWPYNYPWDPTTPVEDNYAPANIGQLKMVFSFDLNGFDSDFDGLPDSWETTQYGNLTSVGIGDPDEDGLTNLMEYDQGSDPLDYYSQGETEITPALTIVSGNNQNGLPGDYLSQSLSVRVLSGTTQLVNAPVVYSVVTGSGGLANTFGGTATSGTFTTRTGSTGLAEAFYKQGAAISVLSQIQVAAGSGTSVTFSSSTTLFDAITFNPAGSSAFNPSMVKIDSGISGSTIHYTTSGSNPTSSDPTIASGEMLRVTPGTVLKAAAWSGSTQVTLVKSGTYSGLSQIEAGSFFTAVVKHDGTVWTWGANGQGQLGDGTPGSKNEPVPAVNLSEVVQVAGGGSHMVALKSNGTVWTTGFNHKGQLGSGTTTAKTTATAVSGLTGVVFVEAGDAHTFAIKNDGTVWAWGSNGSGQLGDGTTTNRLSPVQISGLTGVVAIAGGVNHTIALKSDGTVWAWGLNVSGQLGDGTLTTRLSPVQVSGLTGVVAVSAGGNHSLALKSDGTVKAWGSNAAGQLGEGKTIQSSKTPVSVTGLTNVKEIDADDFHNIAVKHDGTVWTWGNNDDRVLGDGTIIPRSVPVQVSGITTAVSAATGHSHSVVLKVDGTVVAWGINTFGELGDQQEVLPNRMIMVPGVTGIKTLSAGRDHTIALKSSGTLSAWGANTYGQLGDTTRLDRAVPGNVSTLSGVKFIAAEEHSVAVKSDGTLWTWGRNSDGQLGDGTIIDKLAPTQVSGMADVIAAEAGEHHTVAVKKDGTVWTWGDNSLGELGDGTLTQRKTPVQVVSMTGVTAVAAGAYHTVALKKNGTVWAWGTNNKGQLGDGTTTDRLTPVKVNGLSDIIAIATGAYHTLALKKDGTVWAVGYNNQGQLGDNTTTDRTSPVKVSNLSEVLKITAGGYHSAALKKNRTAVAWGSNIYGQLSDGTKTLRKVPVDMGVTGVIDISAGWYYIMAVKEDLTLFASGQAAPGQLGIGYNNGSGVPVPVYGFNVIGGTMPTVSLTAPANNSTVLSGSNPTFTVTTSGTIAKVEYFNEGIKIGESTTSPFSLSTWTAPSWGAYTNFSAIATDSMGKTSPRTSLLTLAIPFDSDDNKLPDHWESDNLGDLENSPTADPDNDGLTNYQEYYYNTNPNVEDTDGDGLKDGQEVGAATPNVTGTDPNLVDSDGNGLDDGEEFMVVNVGISDRDYWDDAWAIYGNGTYITHNIPAFYGAPPIAYRLVYLKRNTIATFTIARVELGQHRSTDEYLVHFYDPENIPDEPIIPLTWTPLAGNSPLDGVLHYNHPNPPDASALRWRFFVPLDTDTDQDGLSDGEEALYGTEETNPDTDGDGMPDGWEVQNQLDPLDVADGELDADSDGLINLKEYQFEGDPNEADTDGDGLPDFWEAQQGTWLSDASDAAKASNYRNGLSHLQQFLDPGTDTDSDGLSDFAESLWQTNPSVADTDGDGVPDGYEVANGLKPALASDATADKDQDQVTNLAEFSADLTTWDYDTDGDLMGDGWEIAQGFNAKSRMDGLQAWWRADYSPQHPLYDSSGNNNDGVLHGEAEIVYRGYFGLQLGQYSSNASNFSNYALSLFGKHSFVTVKNDPSLTPVTDYTWAFEIRVDEEDRGVTTPPAIAPKTVIFEKPGSYAVRLDADTKLEVELYYSATTSQIFTSTTALVETGTTPKEWADVAIVMDSSAAQKLGIYINGALDTETVMTGTSVAQTDWPLIFGSARIVPHRVPLVQIDDIRFYSKALTAPEVTELDESDLPSEALADVDGDGANALQEYYNGTNPNIVDSDGDGRSDGAEINGTGGNYSNPRVVDSDGDGLSDSYETSTSFTDPALSDTDYDGAWDGKELNIYGTDPLNYDTDDDLMPDGWEIRFELNPLVDDSTLDPDEDFDNNLEEYVNGTNPRIKNGLEFGTDTDNDGLSDYMEAYVYGTNPNTANTFTGMTDLERVNSGLLPPLVPYGQTGGTPPPPNSDPGAGFNDGDDLDNDGRTNIQENQTDHTDPNDSANTTKQVFGMKTIAKREIQKVVEGTEFEQQYMEKTQTVTVNAPKGSSVSLQETETLSSLFASGKFVLTGAGATPLEVSAEGGAFDDPLDHLGGPPESAYNFVGAIGITSFVEQLTRDSEDNVTFTITWRVPKEIEIIPREDDPEDGTEPPTSPGGGGSGSGGSGGGAGAGPLNIGLGWRYGPWSLSDFLPTEPDDRDSGTTYASSTITVVVAPACMACSAYSCPFTARNDSLHFQLVVGTAKFGLRQIALSLNSSTMTADLLSPNSLRVSNGSDGEIIRNSSGVLRQVATPDNLADITVVNAYKYQIKVYTMANAGTKDSNGLYQPTGTPVRTITVENPASTSTPTTIKVTEAEAGMGTPRIYEFTYSSSTNEWGLVTGGGLKKDYKRITWNGPHTVRTERRTIKNSTNQEVSVESDIYTNFAWGDELTSRINDPIGAALTTTYTYYTSTATDGVNYGRLKQKVEHTGYWEKYSYDSRGALNKVVSQYLDSASTSGDSDNRVRTIINSDTNPQVAEIETVKGTVVSTRYTARFGQGEEWDIQATRPGAGWTAADNLITKTHTHTTGDFAGEVSRIEHADGTLTTYAYSVSGGVKTVTQDQGAPDPSGQQVESGRRIVRTLDQSGNWLTETTTDIASGLTLEEKEVASRDADGRVTQVDYADGTQEEFNYGCCGLESQTDRDGMVTSYAYDALKRVTETTRAGITTRNEYDAMDRVTKVTRVGSDSSQIVQTQNTYDKAGRLTSTKNALNQQTNYTETYTGGEITRTATLPDGSTTRIEKSYPDGQTKSVGGTGAHPVNYEYGVESGLLFSKEIRVGPSNATSEWVKTFTDVAGRAVKTVYPDGAAASSEYNSKGQLTKSMDPDGVTTLYAYDGEGRQSMMAIDADGSGGIDAGGTDRVTSIARSVVTSHGKVVEKEEREIYTTDNSTSTVAASITERSVDGLDAWSTQYGLETHEQKVRTSAGTWTTTATMPDGSVVINAFDQGRLLSRTQKASSGGTQLGKVEMTYDAHGRLDEEEDARNGVTAYAYDALDRVTSVTQPSADGVAAGQVTGYTYNTLGFRTKTTLPDASETVMEYFPTGELKKTSGSQAYTVEYTYDPQGRMATMKTVGQAGNGITTWLYSSQRGWLTAKRDNSDQGADYTYTAAGRLLTRTWERGVSTTYGYTFAGDLSEVDYSDDTPDVAYAYNRRGLRSEVEDASGVRTLTYNGAGQLTSESYASGLLEGLSLTHAYDSLLRREALTLKEDATALHSQEFGYGAASRLESIAAGDDEVGYTYSANSPLVETVTFSHSGTLVMSTTKSYDYANRLLETESVVTSGTVSRHQYEYTTLNQRNRVDLADGGYWLYTYNSKGELTNGTRYDASDNEVSGLNLGYNFDGIGNRETTSVDGVTASTYAANTLNQYTTIQSTGTTSLAYDADGNMTDNGTILASYDGENRLKSVHRKSDNALIATYTYDDQSRRVRKVTAVIAPQGAGDEVFAWDNWNVVAQFSHNSGTCLPIRYYTWGLDMSGGFQNSGGVGGLVVEKDVASTQVYMPVYDGNGNIVNLITKNGSIAAAYEYDPFGLVVSSSGAYADRNPYRFSTKCTDDETGWIYYGLRYYNPKDGRWLNRDPIEENGGLNLYAGLNNDAVNNVDILGLAVWILAQGGLGNTAETVTKDNMAINKTALERAERELSSPTNSTFGWFDMHGKLEILGKGKEAAQELIKRIKREKLTVISSGFADLDADIKTLNGLMANHEYDYDATGYFVHGGGSFPSFVEYTPEGNMFGNRISVDKIEERLRGVVPSKGVFLPAVCKMLDDRTLLERIHSLAPVAPNSNEIMVQELKDKPCTTFGYAIHASVVESVKSVQRPSQ